LLPKVTPMPANYVPPANIASYLRKDSEVHVRPFLNPWISVNHSKLFLVDGNRAWIGGMNVGREYMHEWHDVMFEIEGPVVASLEEQFDREWAHAGPWGDAAYFATVMKKNNRPEEQGNSSYANFRRLPTSKGLRKPFMTAVLTALEQARSQIWIENGYMFDRGVDAALIRAKKRGVDVRVIQPRLNNFKAGIRSNLAVAERLRRGGVRVFLWPGMTHCKAVLVDGWCCFGSANLNQWSLRLSAEQNMATSDPQFAEQLKAKVFEADFARSYELTEPISVHANDRVVDAVLSY
jgi:cardiolipin synthase A/B